MYICDKQLKHTLRRATTLMLALINVGYRLWYLIMRLSIKVNMTTFKYLKDLVKESPSNESNYDALCNMALTSLQIHMFRLVRLDYVLGFLA